MVHVCGSCIFLHGFFLGRIRLFDQSNSPSRIDIDGNWQVYAPNLCRIQCLILSGNNFVDANSFCRISACSKFRTYAGNLKLKLILFQSLRIIMSLIKIFLFQAIGVFGLCQIHALVDYLRSKLSETDFEILFRGLIVSTVSISLVLGAVLTFTGENSSLFY